MTFGQAYSDACLLRHLKIILVALLDLNQDKETLLRLDRLPLASMLLAFCIGIPMNLDCKGSSVVYLLRKFTMGLGITFFAVPI